MPFPEQQDEVNWAQKHTSALDINLARSENMEDGTHQLLIYTFMRIYSWCNLDKHSVISRPGI